MTLRNDENVVRSRYEYFVRTSHGGASPQSSFQHFNRSVRALRKVRRALASGAYLK